MRRIFNGISVACPKTGISRPQRRNQRWHNQAVVSQAFQPLAPSRRAPPAANAAKSCR